jgi:hypothetical protein
MIRKRAASITRAMTPRLMLEAASTSETSVNLYQTTRCNNQEERDIYILAAVRTSNITTLQKNV